MDLVPLGSDVDGGSLSVSLAEASSEDDDLLVSMGASLNSKLSMVFLCDSCSTMVVVLSRLLLGGRAIIRCADSLAMQISSTDWA